MLHGPHTLIKSGTQSYEISKFSNFYDDAKKRQRYKRDIEIPYKTSWQKQKQSVRPMKVRNTT